MERRHSEHKLPGPQTVRGEPDGRAAPLAFAPPPLLPGVASGEPANSITNPLADHDRLAYVTKHPRRIDQAVITVLAGMLDSQRRLEDTVGATPMLPMVTTQIHTIAQLVREAHGPLRPQLVGVAAQWAQFGGWLHLSADQSELATSLFDRATEWAVEAGDAELLATITSFRGHGAWLTGHAGSLIGLTKAAMRDPTVYVGQRAYDAHQMARGHVLTGNHTAAVELLDQGVDLVAETMAYAGPRPPWHYYRSQAFFDLEAGVVHALLSRVRSRHVDKAVNLLGRGLAQLADDMTLADWTGMYRYHLGTALINVGARDTAESELHKLRAIATATGATRVRDYARSLSATLTQTPGVQNRDGRRAQAGRGRTSRPVRRIL